MPDDLTKDGLPKEKTGPKIGSHHQRGQPIRFAKAGKEAISALSGRVAEIEEMVGLVPGGPIDIKKMHGHLVRVLANGMSVRDKNGQWIHVYDFNRERVWLFPKEGVHISDKSHCKEITLPEFFRLTGMKYEG